jgi:hypothetical protein
MGKGAGNMRAVLGMALLAALAACGGQAPVAETPRPVLVVHPAAGGATPRRRRMPATSAHAMKARSRSGSVATW